MKARGQLTGIARALDGRTVVSLEIDATPEEVKELESSPLDVTLTKHRPRRSLDANAYLWALLSKAAAVLETSREAVYQIELERYGQLLLDDEGNPVTVTVSRRVNMDRIEGHYKRYKESPDGKFIAYLIIRGTSDYNSAEMCRFLDGVIDDCKDLGIETMTPDELAQMKRQLEEHEGGKAK